MTELPRCAFCGRDFPYGTGILYVTNRATQLWFCSRKCKVSMLEFKRKPTKFKWTKKYAKAKTK